ncbi:hypothetical protein H4219_002825 [Mycoemilia scoparia]|uniref:Uncharacterized protein n=1 Tax=Mycoemilia scoparia TaxID=417184 RepID=A0A9W8DTJ9_9FUNG|nr:hypothetical protein H4219_002825 [Mycoemilia scoparia]
MAKDFSNTLLEFSNQKLFVVSRYIVSLLLDVSSNSIAPIIDWGSNSSEGKSQDGDSGELDEVHCIRKVVERELVQIKENAFQLPAYICYSELGSGSWRNSTSSRGFEYDELGIPSGLTKLKPTVSTNQLQTIHSAQTRTQISMSVVP